MIEPIVDDLSRPWWDAAAQGIVMLQRCAACGRAQFYPRARCAACGSAEVTWERSAGRGRLVSFTCVRRAAIPYVLAIVELDEGVRILTHVRGELAALRCDARVRFQAPDASEPCLPYVVLG